MALLWTEYHSEICNFCVDDSLWPLLRACNLIIHVNKSFFDPTYKTDVFFSAWTRVNMVSFAVGLRVPLLGGFIRYLIFFALLLRSEDRSGYLLALLAEKVTINESGMSATGYKCFRTMSPHECNVFFSQNISICWFVVCFTVISK